MVIDYLPRFVLPDNTVIMPENVMSLYQLNSGDWFIRVHATDSAWKVNFWDDDYSISNARSDKQSPYKYQKGKKDSKEMFENDVVNWCGLRAIIFFSEYLGQWMLKISQEGCKNPICRYLGETYAGLEFVSIIPYGESEAENDQKD